MDRDLPSEARLPDPPRPRRPAAGWRAAFLPGDHGAWVFLLLPLLIGIAAGGWPRITTVYLVLAALFGFLLRQPLTLLVKVLCRRKPRALLRPSLVASSTYAALAALFVAGLALRQAVFVLYLALPAALVFGWYLLLVARGAERRAMLLEVLAAGTMALAAPAAMWVGLARYASVGWLLWTLLWAFAAWSIVLVYLKLEQRSWDPLPGRRFRLGAARPALLLATVNLAGVSLLAATGNLPALLPLAYLVPWLETLRAAAVPAIGVKPRAIGFRQLAVSCVFLFLFVAALALGPTLATERRPPLPDLTSPAQLARGDGARGFKHATRRAQAVEWTAGHAAVDGARPSTAR